MTSTTLARRLRRPIATTAIALVLGIGLAAGLTACGADADDARTGDAISVATIADGASQQVPLVGGGMLDLADMSDQPLALWFWAPG